MILIVDDKQNLFVMIWKMNDERTCSVCNVRRRKSRLLFNNILRMCVGVDGEKVKERKEKISMLTLVVLQCDEREKEEQLKIIFDNE